MRQWLASQGFGSVMIAFVAGATVLYVFCVTFGFDEVTGAIGSGMDRIGLTLSEAEQ